MPITDTTEKRFEMDIADYLLSATDENRFLQYFCK